MKKLTSAIFILLFFATVISSCAKKDEFQECLDNPECEYFRCKVDGKLWRPDCESSFLGCDAVDVQYYRETGYFLLSANNERKSTSLKIETKPIIDEGEYSLSNKNYHSSGFADFTKPDSCRIFKIDTIIYSSLIIKNIDKMNLIIEGEMFFETKNNCGEKIVITDGEFRQHYRF